MPALSKALVALSLVLAPTLFAQNSNPSVPAGVIQGLVLGPSSKPIVDAIVTLIETRSQTRSDSNGRFAFTGLKPSRYHLRIQSRLFGSRAETVELGQTQGQEVVCHFDLTVHEELVITAGGSHRSTSDIAQAVNVLNEESIKVNFKPTLGELVGNQPGIDSSSFGPGASRPIIRGLGGDRIRVLENGMGTGDASTVSPDHAVSISTAAAERVEILRGPASLRYGANAVGGVVNVLDERIPEYGPDKAVEGTLELRGESGASMVSTLANLSGGSKTLAWHVDFHQVETDDYDVPGAPNPEEPEEYGVQENSDLSNKNASLGLSHIMPNGFIGVSVSRLESLYGIPGGHEHHHDEEPHEAIRGSNSRFLKEEEPGVRIDMEQTRYDLRGEQRFQDSLISAAVLRFVSSDYQHKELEGDEIGTQFFNKSQELRLEAVHRGRGLLDNGSFGLQAQRRDFSVVGEEANVPPTLTTQSGLYFFEELARNEWRFSFGSRYDRQEVEADFLLGTNLIEPWTRHFNSFSSSIGLVLGRTVPYSLSLQAAHTRRAPNAEELFSFGPHIATRSFEIGNPELGLESSTSLEISLRRSLGKVTGELNLFHNDFSNYIYARANGTEADELPVYIYTAEGAKFKGGEIHLDIELLHVEPHHLALELTHDLVRAELDNGESLPRITPSRSIIGLRYESQIFWSKFTFLNVASQDRIAPLETPTSSYNFIDFDLGFHFVSGDFVHHIVTRASNLGNEEARSHASFLKEQVLLPGRNFSLAYRLTF